MRLEAFVGTTATRYLEEAGQGAKAADSGARRLMSGLYYALSPLISVASLRIFTKAMHTVAFLPVLCLQASPCQRILPIEELRPVIESSAEGGHPLHSITCSINDHHDY